MTTAEPKSVNLNADMGESYGAWTMGADDALLDVVASANLACGFHGGDPDVMRRAVAAARARRVSIGAHPSYPDLQGFGRRRLDMAPAEIEAMVAYQVGALAGIAAMEGARVTHVKPHGALNNVGCADRPVADAIARAVKAVDPGLILLAPACSAMLAAGRDAGLRTAVEVFADRAYQDDGQLVPRSHPGAFVHGAEASLAHVLRMLDEGALVSLSGRRLPTRIDSICVHGDNAQAVAVAAALRQGLEAAGYAIRPLPECIREPP